MEGQLVSAHGMLAIRLRGLGRGSGEVITRLLQIMNLVSTFRVPVVCSSRRPENAGI